MTAVLIDIERKWSRMSEDLIRRSDAIKALDANFTIKGKENMQTVLNYLELVRTRIDGAPTIEPKRGEWIDRSGGIEGAWNYCSVCGEQAIDLYDFCPNCGADMREREGE